MKKKASSSFERRTQNKKSARRWPKRSEFARLSTLAQQSTERFVMKRQNARSIELRLLSPVEERRVNAAVATPENRIELAIRKIERVDDVDGVGANFFERALEFAARNVELGGC